ncbi:MAG TPA: Gfo/Idh/MocA family oxidoreductase [Bryobacteraceae bacterium]|nr:Gfo/Idh/MocA family oxidoreductase [Bryobacteraceae bacterium]
MTQAWSRRCFLASTAVMPCLAAKRVLGANDRIRIGVIGVGNRSGLLIDQLPQQAEVVAVADCFLRRCNEAAGKRQATWRIYQDYRRLLEQKDIDGVIVGTPDHARVLACIRACQAGKDIYAEKPLTLFVEEGRTLVKAVHRYERVFQAGSQQRSMAMNRMACDFVRNGGLGAIKLVQCVNYTGPKRYTPMPEEPAPDTLDWNMWLGQTAKRPYNGSLHKSWMTWWDYSGGEMTNWGAHGLDQVQWALGMDGTGPIEWWPAEDGPEGSIGFRYANGVTVRLDQPAGRLEGGALFTGEKGKIEIIRNNFRTDPPRMIKELPPPSEVQKWRDEVALWQAKYHMENWLDCMRTRSKPLADVEIGHRSVSLGHLANITRQLGRKLVWDPERERFKDDNEANGLLARKPRKGFELPKV